MADKLDTEPLKGVRDFYPDEMAERKALFGTIRRTLELRGYEEYDASPLERSELYESKGNEEIIRDQTYSFTDRGGRRITLRPEMTPSLARMVAGKRRELTFPLRWFNIGNRFRYERPQRGRTREFYQTDVDLIGLPEGEADVEIISIAHALLIALGAKESDFTIRVNSRALLRLAGAAAGLPEGETAKAYWQLLDRREKMSAEEFEKARAEFSADPLRIIEAESDPAVKEEKAKVLRLIEELAARGVGNAVFDTGIVRGFDYYTGTVFEVFDTDSANARSLFGGGRYDGLVSMFGGESVPGIGFAVGDIVIRDFLETHGLPLRGARSADVYIGTPSPGDASKAQAFAGELRDAGIRTFVNLTERALGDQVKEAVKRGIPYFIAFGAEEAKSSMVRLKDLAASEEESIEENQIVKHLKQVLKA